MSDIVWAVNPRRDSLLDLVLRMRSFANEVLAGRQIEFQFVAPDLELSRKLGAELRRDVFLDFQGGPEQRCASLELHTRDDRIASRSVFADAGS